MLPVLFLLLGAAVIPPGQATQTHHHSDSHWHRHAAEAKNAHDDEQQRCNNNPAGPLVPSARETHCPLIIDDETTLSPSSQSNPNPKPPYHPWSYPPLCVHAVDRESEPNKLCTYTVTSLRGGPGLSIITLPIIAAGLSTSLQNPDIPWLEHKRNQPFKPDSNSTPAYEVKEIPGKGLGVVATRDIKKDTIVMLEQPLLLKISDPSPWNHQGALPLMQQAAKRLGKGEQAVLLGLARQGGGRFYILDDIFRTNSFRVQVEGVGHSGIYPSVAVSFFFFFSWWKGVWGSSVFGLWLCFGSVSLFFCSLLSLFLLCYFLLSLCLPSVFTIPSLCLCFQNSPSLSLSPPSSPPFPPPHSFFLPFPFSFSHSF